VVAVKLVVGMMYLGSVVGRPDGNPEFASSDSNSSDDARTVGDCDDVLSDSVVRDSQDGFLIETLISSTSTERQAPKSSLESSISWDSIEFVSFSSLMYVSSSFVSGSEAPTLKKKMIQIQ
jgi:hypothetical protein